MAEDYRKSLLGLIKDDLKVTQEEAIKILEKGGEKLLRAFLGANMATVKKILEEILGQQIQFGDKAVEEFEKQEKRKYEKSGKYAKKKQEDSEKQAKKQKSDDDKVHDDTMVKIETEAIKENERRDEEEKAHNTRLDEIDERIDANTGLHSLATQFADDAFAAAIDEDKVKGDISKKAVTSAKEIAANESAIGTSKFTTMDFSKQIEASEIAIGKAKTDNLRLDVLINEAYAAGDMARVNELGTIMQKNKVLMEQETYRKEGLESLQAHRDIQKEQHDHIVNYEAKQKALLKPMEDLKTKLQGWADTLGNIVSNPMVLLVTLIAAAAKHFAGTEASAEKFRKGLGLTADSTKEIEESAMNVAKNMSKAGQSFEDSLNAAKSLVTVMGDTNTATEENIMMVSKMSKVLGIVTDESAKFLENMSDMAGITVEEAGHLAAVTTELARAADVAPSTVIKDMNTNSEAFASHMKDGGANLAEAAVMAAKLGTSVSSMTDTAEKLLDINQSIQDEMEAEALLGRDINLEKARQLAYDGEIADMAVEISKQVGTSADWSAMAAHERKALAKAMGMEVSEMGKMIKNQELLADLDAGRLSVQEAMAAGLSFEEVMDTGDVNSSITNIKNSISAIAFNLLEVFRPVFEGLAPILSALATGLGKIAKLLNSSIGKFFVWFFVAIQTYRALQKGHWIAEKAHMLWKSAFGVKSFAKRMLQIKAERIAKRKAAVEEKLTASASTKSSSGTSKVTGGIGKMKVGKVLAGAAALVIVAAAMSVFAKALQEMPTDPAPYIGAAAGLAIMGAALFGLSLLAGNLIIGAAAMLLMGLSLIPFAFGLQMLSGVDYGQIALAGVTLIAFTAAIFGLGAIMMSGVGALIFGAGILAFIAMGGALIILGIGIAAVGGGMTLLSTGLESLGTSFASLSESLEGFNILGILPQIVGLVTILLPLTLIAPAAAYALTALAVAFTIFAGASTLIGIGITTLSIAIDALAKSFQVLHESLVDFDITGVLPQLVSLGVVLGPLVIIAPPAAIALTSLAVSFMVFAPTAEAMSIAIEALAKSFQVLHETLADFDITGVLPQITGLIGVLIPLTMIAPLASAAMALLTGAFILFGGGVDILGVSLTVLNTGLKAITESIILLSENVSNIFLIASAFTTFGLSLISLAAGLALITPFLPTLVALTAIGGMAVSVMNMMGGGEEETTTSPPAGGGGGGVEAKLDKLISIVEQGGVINMDGKKVGEVLGGSVMRPVIG